MLAHYCLDERGGIHALGYLGVEELGTPDWKGALHPYLGKGKTYADIPTDVLHQYNAYDVAVEWQLYERYERELRTQGLEGLHQHLVAASNQLVFLELNGIGVDRTYNDDLMISYLKVIDEVVTEMNDVIRASTDKVYEKNARAVRGGSVLNPASPQQVKEWLYDQGIRVATTDKETLEAIQGQVAPESIAGQIVRLLLKHRREAKLYGTYVKGIRRRLYGGRVFPTFLLHGTTTGRLACRNPNLQNIPRESSIRRQFAPTKSGNVFVQADYSQAEARVLTWLAGEEYLRDIFNDPSRDLFDELTSVLYGDVSGLAPAAKKELRIRTKAYFYGLSYGREEVSIAAEFGISVAEAREGMRRFFSVIPNIVSFYDDLETQVLHGADIVSPFGRRRRNHLITRENQKDLLKEARAFLPQSTASDICLSAFVELRPRLRGIGFVRNIIHDAILVEVPEDRAEEVGELMKEIMTRKGNELVDGYVNFATDVSIGRNWGEV